MGKYTPLSDFLKAQNASEIVMSFAEIERVIGAPLPEQAETQRAWWRGGSPSNLVAEAWREAGFAPDLVDMEERRLLFRRATSDQASVRYQEGDPIELVNGRHPIFGALKDVTHLVEGVDLTEPADPDWARIADAKTL